MFNFFKFHPPTGGPKPSPARTILAGKSNIEILTLHLSGLHCTSCAVNIDLALEDLPGVTAKTSYTKSETKVTYDQGQTTLNQIHFTIRDLGYNIL